jgi:GNAT superfamily N-acetyltransferase
MIGSALLPNGLIIRPASELDAEALSKFAELSFRDAFGRDNTASDMEHYISTAFSREKQRAQIINPAGTVLLAESGGNIVGYAQLCFSTAPAVIESDAAIELQRFYVAREWHGAGLASHLMERAIAVARERGATSLWLGVWERNARAIAFYGKHDFVDVGSQSFTLGSDNQTDRIMFRRPRD